MDIYFVRHGQTAETHARVHQSPQSPLSLLGKQQAHALAKRLQGMSFTRGLCSPWLRAQQTAAILNQHVSLTFQTLDAIKEWEWPSCVYGKSCADPDSFALKREVDRQRADNPHYRHSDEETFVEFIHRLKQTKAILEQYQPADVLLLVSHDVFIKAFLAYVLYGETMTVKQLLTIKYLFTIDNTGVVYLRYHEKEWQVKAWNDCAHLLKGDE